MDIFTYTKADNVHEAILASSSATTAQQGAEVRFIAGGTTLFDLMKLNVEQPTKIIDINRLPLNKIEELSEGGLKIGALVRNVDLAHHPAILSSYQVLSQALLAGASAQLRNMATTGGNLLQRTRCMYFRNVSMACNKRSPQSGCAALDGDNRMLAVLGTSEHCIATNPSDMNVALTALEAVVHIHGQKGERAIAINDFFLLPGHTPERENVLEPGDLITSISLPTPRKKSSQIYVKLRDRASYEFALCSAAIVAEISAKKFHFLRLALGGVGTKPWRSFTAEEFLVGKEINEKNFLDAADIALSEAKPESKNGFKLELTKRCIVHALKLATK